MTHPEFEAIAEIIFAKKIDTDYFRKAAQLNAHLTACPECKKIYDVLLTAADRAEAYVLYTVQTERAAAQEEKKIALQDLIQSGQSFLLKVKSLREIIAEELTMYHPVQLATVKSAGEHRENVKMTSVLVDEGGNRIRVDEDGSLSLYFDRAAMPVGQMVVLIPEDQTKQEMIGIAEEYDRTTTRVYFDGIEPGAFRVLVG